ncbi:MAG: HAMP domain-containing protein [Elusimicrobia bacterium]|nr:HAMP domain-containing protein [Elusimicrobiota bacterium]
MRNRIATARGHGLQRKHGAAALPGDPGSAAVPRPPQAAADTERQLGQFLEALDAVRNGNLTIRLKSRREDIFGDLADSYNDMVEHLNRFGSEVTRVAREVGTEGRLGGQAVVPGVGGTWREITDNVNAMANNITVQMRSISSVTTAVANGDLAQEITVSAQGEVLELKNTINKMVDNLNTFAAEVTRVAKEVGTEGKLGGQAQVPKVAGVWKGLTDTVNMMAGNMSSQLRNISQVATAVANGDLSQKITVDVKGEVLELKNTINKMVDNLNTFAAEVTRVAKGPGRSAPRASSAARRRCPGSAASGRG